MMDGIVKHSINAGDLQVGDAVVIGTTTWVATSVTRYTDRDGRDVVAATGTDHRGERFAIQRRAARPVTVVR